MIRAAALLFAALSLSGCVAAAIPLVAAGTMVKRAADGSLDGTFSGSREKRIAAKARPAPVTDTLGDDAVPTKVTLLPLTELPPPSGTGSDQAREDIVEFATYALQQATREPASTPRDGALLAIPGSLEPARQDCGTRSPAILIDLDPGRDTFDPLADFTAPPALAPALFSLRTQGVSVIWQSRLGEHFGVAVRDALAQAGLDKSGGDRLLLARSIEERQQSLRADVAQSHCIVAMLGDERADFDELFLYLRDADAAIALETMIGAGWFLTEDFSTTQASARAPHSPSLNDYAHLTGETQ